MPKKIIECDILSDFQTMCNMSYDVGMNSSSFQLIGHASFVAKCSLQKVTDRSNFYSIWGLLALKHPSRLRKKSFRSAKKPPEALEYFLSQKLGQLQMVKNLKNP